jgi:hypothetical protein
VGEKSIEKQVCTGALKFTMIVGFSLRNPKFIIIYLLKSVDEFILKIERLLIIVHMTILIDYLHKQLLNLKGYASTAG